MTEDPPTQQDPMQQYPRPDQQAEQELEHPGLESEMRPTPDYGEDTYYGSGRLEGRAAIVTGGDISEFGKIDILVNNAAYQMYREGLQSISAQELEHTYRTNVFSNPSRCCSTTPPRRPP
jgi:hypothetical protein